MIKDKLNNDNLNDINGGLEHIDLMPERPNNIDFDALKQSIDTDTDLRGLINTVCKNNYLYKYRSEKLLEMLNRGMDSIVREKIYELAKKDSSIAITLNMYYRKKSK